MTGIIRKSSSIFTLLFILVLLSFLALTTSMVDYGDNFYLYGDRDCNSQNYLQNSIYSKKYEQMKKKINRDDSDSEFFFNLAAYSVFMDNPDECQLFLEKALEKNPDRPDYLFEIHNYLGCMFADIQNNDNAAEELRIIKRAYPGTNGAYELQGYLYDNLRDSKGARKALMGEYANSTCTDNIVAMGHICLANGEHEHALKKYKAGMYFDPGCSYLLTSSAIACLEKKDFRQARNFINEAIKMNPLWGMNYVVNGNIDAGQGQFEKSLDSYYKSIHIDPRKQEHAYVGIGQAYLGLARGHNDFLPSSAFIIIFLALVTIIIIFINIKDYNKKIKNRSMFNIRVLKKEKMFLLLVVVVLNIFAVYLLGFDTTAIYRATHQKTVYLKKSEDALKKAVQMNPNRSDIYMVLSETLKLAAKNTEAAKYEQIAKKLPTPDIRQKLYIIY